MTNLPFRLQNNVRNYNFADCLKHITKLGKSRFGQKFELHKCDHNILYKLICYAIRDEERCTELGMDINKGIILAGPVGCGKSAFMNLINEFNYPDRRYKILSTKEVAVFYNIEGYKYINNIADHLKHYCFDDLGVEPFLKHMGNECNTMEFILFKRYDLFKTQGILTHITTNLNADQVESIYGTRIRSRMREMFNLVAFSSDTPDKRK
jgi:ABC-type polar amino acid transport system ATPase subunit